MLERGKIACAGALPQCLEFYRDNQPTNNTSLLAYHDKIVQQAEIKLKSNEHISGQDLILEINYTVERSINFSLHVLFLVDNTGTAVAVCDLLAVSGTLNLGLNTIACSIKALSLRPGFYTLGIEALSDNHSATIVRKRFTNRIRVRNSISHWCSYTPMALKL
jgi:hypothetical protein